MGKKFELGQVVMTSGVAGFIAGLGPHGDVDLMTCIARHEMGDWGLVPEDDKRLNEEALEHDGRLMSSYDINGTRIWVITEWDRSVTTVLFPSEY